MKYQILILLCVFAAGCPSTKPTTLPFSPIPQAPVGTPAYKAYVKGLVCPSCAVGLKKGLMKLSFIKSIHVNYKTGLVLIYEIDNRIDHKGIRKFDKPRITKAVEDSGYNVDKFIK